MEHEIKISLNKLSREIKCNFPFSRIKIFYPSGKRKTSKRLYIKVSTKQGSIFGKFSKEKDKGIAREAKILEKISVKQFYVPKVLLKVNNGFFMFAVKGYPMEFFLKDNRIKKSIKILEKAVSLMAKFHTATEIQHISFKKKLYIYSKLTGKFKVNDEQRKTVESVSIGYMHGDLDPFNMFFEKKTGDYALIDWENFCSDGFQELDILHFLIMTSVIFYPKENFKNLYTKIFIANTDINKIFNKLLDTYCKLRKKNKNQIMKLLPIYCDFQIKRLLRTKRNPQNFVYPVFKKLFYETQRNKNYKYEN